MHNRNSVSLKEHLLLIRAADDRRYAEVNIEREKALKIKEEADKAALGLAREIQTYKDEKANELREQISSERNLYVTKAELESAIRELKASATAGAHWNWSQVTTVAIIAIAAAALYFKP